MDFGQKLQILIKARGIALTQLAANTGMSVSTIQRYIRGETTPKLPELTAFSKEFNVSIAVMADPCLQLPKMAGFSVPRSLVDDVMDEAKLAQEGAEREHGEQDSPDRSAG